MNIFKLLFQSIKLRLYIIIAKRNLQIIKYFERQKEYLDEIMTSYKVENELVELKTPLYEYYKAFMRVSLNDTLKTEISESDVLRSSAGVKTINNPFEISEPGYYCILDKKEDNFAIIDGKKHVLDDLCDGLPYKEITREDIVSDDGYYKKHVITKHYYLAENKINLKKIELSSIPEEELVNVKLVKDTSCIDAEGYYKVIV